MTPIRLLIADDNELVRAGLRCVLREAPEVEVVAEAADGPEAVRLTALHAPDLLLLDHHLPGLDALAVLRRIPAETRPRAILLVNGGEGPCMVEAIGAGAAGFLHLAESATQLVSAVRVVRGGGTWLRPPLCLQGFTCAAATAAADCPDPYHALTPREKEVLLLVADGQSNAGIGKKLFISPRTVELHRARAMRKLGITSVPEVVRYAIRRGLVGLGT